MEIGVQSQNIVYDDNPDEGFELLKRTGFDCTDFSLNSYFLNSTIYRSEYNGFFDRSIDEVIDFFAPHKEAAKKYGIRINQMHMPYPLYVPNGQNGINDYMRDEVAVKSLAVCGFLKCPHIVVHGFKLTRYYGSEEAEWEKTREFLEYIAPMAIEAGTIICLENLYNGLGTHMIEGPGCDAEKMAKRIDDPHVLILAMLIWWGLILKSILPRLARG